LEERDGNFPKVGEAYRRLMEVEQFDAVTRGLPAYSFEEAKEICEKEKDTAIMAVQQLWWRFASKRMTEVEKDCGKAQLEFKQEDVDKITYFATKLICNFSENPHTLIALTALLKDAYGVDVLGSEQGQMSKKKSPNKPAPHKSP